MQGTSTILITADALRADHLEQYGYYRDTMPCLDRLITEGEKFTSAYSNGPHTVQSIPSLLTSRIVVNSPLKQEKYISTILSDANARSAAFHSNTALYSVIDEIPGFHDEFNYTNHLSRQGTYTSLVDKIWNEVGNLVDGPNERSHISKLRRSMNNLTEPLQPDSIKQDYSSYVTADGLTEDVIDWLDENRGEKFFLWVHYMDPHRPYGTNIDNPSYIKQNLTDQEKLRLVVKASQSPGNVTCSEYETLINLYDSDIRFMANNIGRLFDYLMEIGLWDDTNLIFTADHGEEFYEHGLFDHRNRPYDELIHVPLIVNTASNVGTPSRRYCSLLDIPPTICDFHDINIPTEFEGASLYGETADKAVSTGGIVENDKIVAVRTIDRKFIYNTETGEAEYYNLKSDPREKKDLNSGEEGAESDIRQTALRLADRIGNEGFDKRELEDEDVRKRLERLGYME